MTRTIVRTATIALATAALAAPTALARPDTAAPVAKPAAPAVHKAAGTHFALLVSDRVGDAQTHILLGPLLDQFWVR